MTLPRTVATVISRHVTLEVESIDRMYLNVYQPRLQTAAGWQPSSDPTVGMSLLRQH